MSSPASIPLDINVPRQSYSQVLEEFPQVQRTDYPAPAKYDTTNLKQPLSIQLPYSIEAERTRVIRNGVDLRYDLIRHDPVRGEKKAVVGRVAVPSQALLGFTKGQTHSDHRLILAPVAAPLASSVVDKNVSTAASHIKVLFPDVVQGESLSLGARATIRTLAGKVFAPERFVWRLASLYLAAAWTEIGKGILTTRQRDLPDIVNLNSVGAFNAVLTTWEDSTQAICVYHEGYVDEIAGLIPILMLAASTAPRLCTTEGVVLPSVAQVWPEIGGAKFYYCGPQLGQNLVIGDIGASHVYEAAQLWCGQHGCMQMFLDMVNTIAALWTSTDHALSPIFQSERMTVPLPVSTLSPCVLLPIAQSYTTWRDEYSNIPPPSKYKVFLAGAQLSVLAGLGVRTYAYRTGLPYAQFLDRASSDVDLVLSSFKVRSNACGAMFQAQQVLRNIGCTGTLGGILLGISPGFSTRDVLMSWWMRHSVAYQWEEVANAITSVPRCCALAGLVSPLHTARIPIVGTWYATDVVQQSRSVEEALQGLFHVPDLEIGWQISDGHKGLVRTTSYTRVRGYRGLWSDWQFLPRYTKEYVSVEMVFRITTTASALLAHTGPMGSVLWKWYVSRPVVDEEVMFAAAVMDASTDQDGGGGAYSAGHVDLSSAAPATAAPSEKPADGDQEVHSRAQTTAGGADGVSTADAARGLADAVSKARTLLKDAGQPVSWLDSLEKGVKRALVAESIWQARDEEGYMRSAWDSVASLDPIATLRAVPNAQRHVAARALSTLYTAACVLAHSPTAQRGWIEEAIRMKHRADALTLCPAMSRIELQDWANVSKVRKAGSGVNDTNIVRALSAGVDAGTLMRMAINSKARKESLDENDMTLDDLPAIEQQVVEEVNNDVDAWVNEMRDAYVAGECDAGVVVDLFGEIPASWIELREVAMGDIDGSGPIDHGGPADSVVHDAQPDSMAGAMDSEKHVNDAGGLTPAELKSITDAVIPPGAHVEPDFGGAGGATSMEQPTPPAESSGGYVPTPAEIALDTPAALPPGLGAAMDAQGAQRMPFTE